MSGNTEITYVRLAKLDNGELCLLKEVTGGYAIHRTIKQLIEGEIVEKKTDVAVS